MELELHRELEKTEYNLRDKINKLEELKPKLENIHAKLESFIPPSVPSVSPVELPTFVISTRDTFKGLLNCLEELVRGYHNYLKLREIHLEGVDPEIEADVKEAAKCYAGGCYKASVAMARRALDNLCLKKGIKGRNLAEKIDRLPVDQAVKNSAHGIREFGNYGAHPQNDLLREATKEVSDIALTIANLVLRQIRT